ncbi:MAG: nucleotide pyrophosphohydrolase [Sedimentisphaerales bacterium]|nr:nucleotide pyrophosphohydrolase [Sedimentisphaerales bacterium]
MSDSTTTIADLKQIVADFADQRDWRQFHSPKNLAMGAAIEAAELMEHFLWLTQKQSEETAQDPQTKHQIAEEISDVFCYLLNLANVMNIDLSEAFRAKMIRNAEKYPVDKYHGKFQSEPEA